MRRCSILPLLVLALSCDACGGATPSDLAVTEPRSYVRCLAMDAEDDGQAHAGAITIERRGRTVTLRGAHPQLLAFSLATPIAQPAAPQLTSLGQQSFDLALVLGGFGTDAQAARATLTALLAWNRPLVLVPGGADSFGAYDAALSELDDTQRALVIDARTTDVVLVGDEALVLVPGAPEGRYALGDDACGYRPDDLDARASNAGARRWLVSWMARTTPGLDGVDAGDPALRTFADRLHATGAIAAFPTASASRLRPTDVVVPSLAMTIERADGTRLAPSALVLTLTPSGLVTPASASN